jgi:hypothetical protein
VNLAVPIAVSVGRLARHRTMLPTESVGLQQLPHPSLAAAVSVGSVGWQERIPLTVSAVA